MEILKKIVVIFFFVFLLFACNQNIVSYEYVGGSENWKAVYKSEVQYLKNGDTRIENELTITYLDEDKKLSSRTEIEITYKIGARSGSEIFYVEKLSEASEIESGSATVNAAILTGNEIGIITVAWDGIFEEFEIKSTKE